jgi:hypothetical protein
VPYRIKNGLVEVLRVMRVRLRRYEQKALHVSALPRAVINGLGKVS